MEIDGENVGCSVYRMKYLLKPSIVRSGGFTMGFLEGLNTRTIAGWLGLRTQAVQPAQYRPGILGPVEKSTPSVETGVTQVTLQGGEVIPMKVVAWPELPETKVQIEKFFRYVRTYDYVEKMDGLYPVSVSPRGGLAFYIELDVETNSFAFSYAICHETDNFCKKTARAICKGRFTADDWYEVENYDPSLGILENIEGALHKLLHNVKKGDTIGPVFSSLSPKMKLYELEKIYERI